MKDRILCIETDIGIIPSCDPITKNDNYFTDVVNSGAEALSKFSTNPYNLVIINHQLSDTTGLLIARQLFAQDSLLPIIILFETNNEALVKEALSIGIINYVLKEDKNTLNNNLPVMVEQALIRGRIRKERRALTTALERSQRQLSAAIKLAKIGFWEWDEIQDHPTYCSPELADILGMTQEEYMDRDSLYDSMSKFVHPKDQERIMWINSDENKTRLDGFIIDYKMITPDGTNKHVQERASFELDKNGKAIRSFGTLQDITKQKEIEDALTKALTDAERANQAKSEFLATMSHEFRTPLNAILGFSEMMRAQYFGPLGSGKYSGYAEDIFNSGEHMLALVNDVLDIAAIEAGKRTITKEKINIKPLIKECLKNIEKLAFNKELSVHLDIPNDIPALYADKRSAAQIIINILSNAAKFTPNKGMITIIASSTDAEILLTIKDTGIGIPKDMLSIIIEPFIQSDKDPHTAQEGTGLGLSIVKSLIEAHGGTLMIESEVNVGTTISMSFPHVEL